jgi:hypothetical protein
MPTHRLPYRLRSLATVSIVLCVFAGMDPPNAHHRVIPGIGYTIRATAGEPSGGGAMAMPGAQNYTGHAMFAANRGRMDITDGGVESLFTKGDYILFDSTDLIIVHPATKDFVSLPFDVANQGLQRLQALGVKFTIKDVKVTLDSIGAGDTVAGYATRHFRMTTAFNMSIDAGFTQTGLGTESVTDYWVAVVPGLPGNPLLRANGLSAPGEVANGMFRQVSSKVDSAAKRLGSGVALRTTTLSRMNQGPGTSATTQQTSEVSDIHHQDVDENLLILPEGYKAGSIPGLTEPDAKAGVKWRTRPR